MGDVNADGTLDLAVAENGGVTALPGQQHREAVALRHGATRRMPRSD